MPHPETREEAATMSREAQDERGGGVAPRASVHPVLWVMFAVMAGFEIMFWLVEQGVLPASLGRWPMYLRFAFFDVLFDRALAGGGVAPQLLWSPVTHAFLHGGPLHLALNGAVFLGLGHALVRGIGAARFLLLFALTAAAGAITFGLLAEAEGPLVGASGALFGMLGIVTAWQERSLRRLGRSRSPIWKRIFALVLINVVLAVGLGGLLAWEAHLGGFLAGWLLAYVMRPRGGPLMMF